MNKKLLYVEDLYDFYVNTYKNSVHFDAQKSGKSIVVQTHGTINFENTNKDTEGLYPVHLQACHTSNNLNHTYISDDVMLTAMPSIKNRPILAYIHNVVTDEHPEGQLEFYNHAMHEDENGELVYDEVPIGLIPESCNEQLIYDEEKDKKYCEVDGYIYEEYSKAKEILEREKECAVSVELNVRALSYDAKTHQLNIEDFSFNGITILGKTPSGKPVMPGMEKSNIKILDFSAKNNSLFSNYDSKMIELQDRLEKLESACFNKNNTQQKGGNSVNKELFENLLAKYNKTAEDITFEYENLSDEDLTAKFAEMFDEDADPDPDTGSDGNNGDSDGSSKGDGDGQVPADDNDNSEGNHEDLDDVPPANQKKTYTIEFNGVTRTFELSCNEKIIALQELVNATYSDVDNTWYGVTVYDEYLIMQDYWYDKYYKQTYTQDGDEFTLTGDRVEVFVNYLTKEQEESLANMKANYSELVQYKTDSENAKLRAEKEAVLSDEKYSVLCQKNDKGEFENEAYAKLYSEMDNYSVEDLTKELKGVFCDYITSVGNYSALDNNTKGTKKISFGSLKSKPKKRYGTLFDKN